MPFDWKDFLFDLVCIFLQHRHRHRASNINWASNQCRLGIFSHPFFSYFPSVICFTLLSPCAWPPSGLLFSQTQITILCLTQSLRFTLISESFNADANLIRQRQVLEPAHLSSNLQLHPGWLVVKAVVEANLTETAVVALLPEEIAVVARREDVEEVGVHLPRWKSSRE
jgi:hypothetical protein